MKVEAFLMLMSIAATNLAAAGSDIDPPAKRQGSLNMARALLANAPETVDPAFVAQNNPFNPAQPVAEAAELKPSAATPASLGERDILAGVSSSVTPSGTIKLGDTQYLLFGQKKLKVGDSISIVFQGAAYELQITGIDRTSYTLRLNQEEITKPIKPSK